MEQDKEEEKAEGGRGGETSSKRKAGGKRRPAARPEQSGARSAGAGQTAFVCDTGMRWPLTPAFVSPTQEPRDAHATRGQGKHRPAFMDRSSLCENLLLLCPPFPYELLIKSREKYPISGQVMQGESGLKNCFILCVFLDEYMQTNSPTPPAICTS